MKKIAHDLYQISLMPRNAINCYVSNGILFDSGIKPLRKQLLNKLSGLEIHTHALTHSHPDHQGASSYICEKLRIPLLCSPAEKANMESGKATSSYPNPKHILARLQQRFWTGDAYTVSQELREGDWVGEFRVVDTPGHSPSHISFFREKDGILILGDVLTNMNLITSIPGLHEPPSVFTSHQKLNRQSILKIAELQPALICFGHGPVLYDNSVLQKWIKNRLNDISMPNAIISTLNF